ncbi:helix-turn-helix domain-containing protein [Leuconostoc citreum]
MLKFMLRDLRKTFQLSQEQFGAKIFVSRQTVSNCERGVSEPPLATLLAIANTFDVQLTTLLEHLHLETD